MEKDQSLTELVIIAVCMATACLTVGKRTQIWEREKAKAKMETHFRGLEKEVLGRKEKEKMEAKAVESMEKEVPVEHGEAIRAKSEIGR